MTYIKAGDEVREIKISLEPTMPKAQRVMPDPKQYCCQESDERLRQMIRGLSFREQQIALDELGRCFREYKEVAT